MTSEQRYRAAIIGHTGHGNFGHGLDTCLVGLPRVETVAIADPDDAGRAAAKERSGAARAYADYRKMLATEQLDIVVIAPRFVDERMDMVRAAVEAGCHLYVEKPLIASLADADEIVDLTDRAGVRIAVAHPNRLFPATLHTQELLKEGRIGRLRQVRGYGKMDHRGGMQDLAILGPHILDLMRLFAGEAHWCSADLLVDSHIATPADVQQGTDGIGPIVGNGLRATYGFDDGVVGSFESFHDLSGNGAAFGIDLVGNEGQLSFRGGWSKRVHFYPHPYPMPGADDDRWVPVPMPSNDPTETSSQQTPGEVQRRAHQRLVLDLLEAIEEQREPASSGHRARAALELIQAVASAHASGGRVPIPLTSRIPPYATPTHQ